MELLNIQCVLEEHPRLFNKVKPFIGKDVPQGWVGLIRFFCSFLEAHFAADQLACFAFKSIGNVDSHMVLGFQFGCRINEHQEELVDAKIFALAIRSYYTCWNCGNLIEDCRQTRNKCASC